MEVVLKEEFIRLGQALKTAGLCRSGAEAKEWIQSGRVLVNGEKEERRGRKLYAGDEISFSKETVKIVK